MPPVRATHGALRPTGPQTGAGVNAPTSGPAKPEAAFNRRQAQACRPWCVLACILTLTLGTLPSKAAPVPAHPLRYSAQIRWTQYGIPHIAADDLGGLGFGAGYAFAEQNACLLFDTALTVRGERSQYLGPQGEATAGFATVRNIESDIFFRSYFDVASLAAGYRNGSPDSLALLQGYVAGANRYLAQTGVNKLPAACRGAPWVRPLTFDDIVLMMAQKAVEASGSIFISAILNAAPPGAIERPLRTPASIAPPAALPKPGQAGSNAYALGKDLTASGHAILVGNPHFPWQGHNRFFEMQLTVPGRLDVMGATLLPLPVINIGFNRDVAWSHTVSTGRRFTLFELHLVPGHPLEYRVDGHIESIKARTVIVPSVDANRVPGQVAHTVYETRFGPIVAEPMMGLKWTSETAFALADAEAGNTRLVEQWLRLNEAKSVSDIRSALADVQGAPWVNTIAADRGGAVLYADYSVVPAVSDALLQECKGSVPAQQLAAKSAMPVL
ncbi:MAG TPA: penicillin acylase family protein, partial [Rhodopila sp.]